LIVSNAGRYYENDLQLQSLFNALFLTTTEDQFLSDWGQIFGFTQKEATQASGSVTSTGTLGTSIPIGTILTNSSGSQYTSTSEGTVASINLAVTLSRIGSTVEAVTSVPHNFATGISVTISGASDSDYDGVYSIIVLDDVTFTYEITTTPATSDSANVQANIASYTVQSSEILDVRNSILEIYPANSNPANLFVGAPTPVTINFNFSSVSPNTPEMQEAIQANLAQYFLDQAGVGDNILQIAYNSVIYNTIDPVTGAQVSNFSLTSPTGNVAISDQQIGLLGDVTF
jgi:uncharacterized phage protein gp47/JayE